MRKKVLILVNLDYTIYNFRRELVESLLQIGYDVYVISPCGPLIKKLIYLGCKHIKVALDRHGTNPIKDLKLLYNYISTIKKINPDIVLTYTIKPNIYGGIACRLARVPYIACITGLGGAMVNSMFKTFFLLNLYRIALKKSSCVFFQNKDDMSFFKQKKIVKANYRLIPGSGVNLEQYRLLKYPDDGTVQFLFISRIRKDKGIDEYLDAAYHIKQKYPATQFHVLGFCEDNYEEKLSMFEKMGIIKYHHWVGDIIRFYEIAHCIIHPTYYPEGMSNVLLESAACGRPSIATDRTGCREVIDDGINGYLVKPKDLEDLINKIELFLTLKKENRKKMGLAGRIKVERNFNRDTVIASYVEQISIATNFKT